MTTFSEGSSVLVTKKKYWYSSPSYAALFCIKDAGSNRDSVNGWTKWKIKNGEQSSEIRSSYLRISETDKNKNEEG